MATYAELAQILVVTSAQGGNEFQQRVQHAMSVAAVAAYNEVPTTPNHAARVVFAFKVVTGNYNLLGVCHAILTFANIVAEAIVQTPGQPANNNGIPDADLQTAANSVFGALATS